MLAWLTDITSILIVLPIALFIVIVLVTKKVTGKSAQGGKIAADVTTFFFILADHLFLRLLFDRSLLLYMLLVMFLLGIFVVSVYAKREGEINYSRLIRGYWRLCFVLFAALYVILFVVGLVLSLLYILA